MERGQEFWTLVASNGQLKVTNSIISLISCLHLSGVGFSVSALSLSLTCMVLRIPNGMYTMPIMLRQLSIFHQLRLDKTQM